MTDAKAEWIAVDWGTSNLRAWIFGAAGQPIDHLSSDQGMGKLGTDEFEAALLTLVAPYLRDDRPLRILCCGMVGARQGWVEAAYARTPCPVPGLSEAVSPPVSGDRLHVAILPGVMQADPPDVMRGEETQIGGYLSRDRGFDGVICLPGTHTKWVHVSVGEIVSFRTFMTGELFELLTRHSILRFSTSGAGWDAEAFQAAVENTISTPRNLSALLFGLRAGSLLNDTLPATNRAALSGLLIGLELGGSRDYWLGRNVVIIGDANLSALYADALAGQGVNTHRADGGEMVLAGLISARASSGAWGI